MSDKFKIYISHLRQGKREIFEGNFSSSFMDLQEKEISFPWPIELKAEAYLAGQSLIVDLTAHARAEVKCAICNEPTSVNLRVENYLHEEKMENIDSGVFDFGRVLREAILLELPFVTECNGNCPERKFIQAYLKKN